MGNRMWPIERDFCPHDDMFARCLLSSRVRLSVRLYVCHKPELYQNGYTQDHADNAVR